MTRLIALLILFLPFSSIAQKWEVGVFGGSSHYNGDLSEGIVSLEHLHFSFGGLLKYNLNKNLTLRGGFYYGTISGSDADATDARRRLRNLNFTSQITELSIIPEFNLTGYKIRSKRMKFSPFVYAGIGIFKFNPVSTRSNGQTISLQPLRTEGQGSIAYNDRDLYALTQVCIPLGVGVKYAIGWNINIAFEISARKVFTDYLDDVSTTYVEPSVFDQTSGAIGKEMADRRLELEGASIETIPVDELYGPRGNSATQDWYYMAGISITYTIFPPSCFKF